MAATAKPFKPQFQWEIQQNQPTTRDAFSGVVDNWTTITTVWAEVAPVAGQESFNAVQMQSNIRHRAKFRWIRGLTLYASMRLRRWKNGTERILNFAEPPRNLDEANFWCEVLCIEQQPATVAEVNQGEA